MNYWQVAAGDTDRNFVDVCLKYDVILNGPGTFGPWSDDFVRKMQSEGFTSRKISDIRRFCEEIKDGDCVILRLGTNEVYGVGIVDGGYGYNECFCDVDGWDLHHYRRIKWTWRADEAPKVFDTYTLNFGDTTQRLEKSSKNTSLFAWIEQVLNNFSKPDDLAQLPQASDPVTSENISELLLYCPPLRKGRKKYSRI